MIDGLTGMPKKIANLCNFFNRLELDSLTAFLILEHIRKRVQVSPSNNE